MNNILTKSIARIACRGLLPPSRPADLNIGGDDDTYMARWYLVPRNRWFNVYLHHVIRADDDRALHDHPWWSLSLMLKGGMAEVDDRGTRFMSAGALRLRSATYRHRLADPWPNTWTLFVTGPRLREWGFHCPQGWRHWTVFTSGKNGERVGLGCGEADQ